MEKQSISSTLTSQLHHRVWSGCVPLCIKLSRDEVVSLTSPDPIYILLPRRQFLPNIIHHYNSNSYQGQIISQKQDREGEFNEKYNNIIAHFQKHAPLSILPQRNKGPTKISETSKEEEENKIDNIKMYESMEEESKTNEKTITQNKSDQNSDTSSSNDKTNNIWFENELDGSPLKWHLPIGVLFDLFISERLRNAEPIIPWSIIIHFQSFPQQEVLRFPLSEHSIKQFYFNLLKESNYLKFGDGGRLNSLSIQHQNNIWNGFISGNYEEFSKGNNILGCEIENLNVLPIRVIRKNIPFTQEPLYPFHQNTGTSKNLGEVIKELCPDLFNQDSSSSSLQSSLSSSSSSSLHPISLPHYSSSTTINPFSVFIQGIQPPLTSPITWIYEHMSHPDHFLYIIIVPHQS